jgi:hypothetical protein
LAAGASGGKLLGRWWRRGFFLFIVEPGLQKDVRRALNKMTEVPIRLEHRGSHIVLYDPGFDTASVENASILPFEHRLREASM